MNNYASMAFTEPVKQLQDLYGSRQAYERMEKMQVTSGLTDNEIRFIGERDNFYMASIGENGYPYLQHRGGPEGFVKVIDEHTLGFVDYSGNKQYITVGNLQTHQQVAVIMVSYPHQARLKLYADARILQIEEHKELFRSLDPAGYKHKPERLIILDIKAFDWNCPQHITPRYTAAEVMAAMEPQRQRIADLEAEVKRLKSLMGKG